MIKVEGLTKSFGPQKVLRELSLDVATGTITIVIGRSGGGKSVFLKHLVGLIRPDRSEEHTSELQSLRHLVCRLLLEKKNTRANYEHKNNTSRIKTSPMSSIP